MKRFQPRGDRRLGKQDRRQLHVLYEDDAVVVLNKRAKLLAVPADDSDTPSALSILSAELKSKRQRAFVVHRIDRHTSGILLFAKTWPDREALVQQFIDTPRCGNISQQFVVISALKKGLSFTTFGKKECFKS
jgi:23S rRNA-/tRNA-specific pseudouridylate synthase